MGIFIFLALAVVEIAIAIYCLHSKENQPIGRGIIRIASLLIFLLLVFLKIIDWSFRYYALASLLILMVVIGVVSLLRNKPKKNVSTTKRVVLKTIGMIVVIFAVTLPAIIFPQYRTLQVTGKYHVTTATYTYTDENRIETFVDTGENRKVNVGLWFPEKATGKTFPLVVFSHGGISNNSSNESLYNELASHGYVVCSIAHPYHSISTTDEDGNTIMIDSGFMKELNAENAKSDRQESYDLYQKWMELRVGDVSFVIDRILKEAENDATAAVYTLVDKEKIGVMGHSLGGAAALGIGRIRSDVKAVIALESPFMCDIEGVENGEFVFKDDVYPKPVLNVYSDAAWPHLAEWPQYAQNHKLLSESGEDAFNVYIKGVGHLSLTDLSLSSPLLTQVLNGQKSTKSSEDCLQIINKVCLEFFDCYLKGKGEFNSAGTF